MRILIILLVSLSAPALAAEFPTGTFLCRDGERQATLEINRVSVGGMVLPLMKISNPDRSGRGIGSITQERGYKRLVLSGGTQFNFVVWVSTDGESITNSPFGPCVKQDSKRRR